MGGVICIINEKFFCYIFSTGPENVGIIDKPGGGGINLLVLTSFCWCFETQICLASK